jgi:hypothetical protein
MSSHPSVGGGRITQIHQIPLLIPSAVGAIAFACTIFVHVLPVATTVIIFRREKKLGPGEVSFWREFAIVALIISFALVAHLIEIAF